MARLRWVLQHGVSLAGDCIFNEALLSLCPGLWYDYAGSYTMVFPVLGAPLLVGGALLFLLPCVAPVSLHH